ncbi:MAG: VCBS repeat-containing protein, partial [Candidatus Omnitrophica bacterium]|nr:VCBS repeat-containing protein [Candidatus Omnitrophota bacterium]
MRMRTLLYRELRLTALAGTAAWALWLQAGTNSNQFGFTGPEIFPIDPMISQLRAADVDGDGLEDLIVVNNARSKINLLYNQTGHTNAQDSAGLAPRREVNELPPDARFRIESIASEKRIASLVVADLNSDGRPDIAYYGEPKELVVQYNEGTNGWSTPKRWPIDDGILNPNALADGDLNGDSRADLVLLGENGCYLLAQQPDHSLGEPERIPYTGMVKSVQVLDIDGDGRDDLLLVNWDSPNPFRFRLQNAEGRLGPEVHFTLPPIRSYLADDLNGDHKTEIVTIAQNSGRAQLDRFTRQPAEPLLGVLRKGQFQVLPLNRTGKAKRGIAWADLNNDRRPDLLVAEPDSGQITAFTQQPDGSLAAPKSFPCLSGVTDLSVADWNDDGVPEIFLLSADERQIGVARMDAKGRIPFPDILPLEGRPLALVAGRIRPDAKPVLALILDQDGRRVLQIRTADGQVRSQKLSADFKSNPSAMEIHDVDQDGLADLVILIPYEKIKVLRQRQSHDFEELDIAPPGGTTEQPWMSQADVDGDGKPELLLAQKNYVRAVVLQAETPAAGSSASGGWNFRVKDQINGASSNSRIVGAAALPNGTNRVDDLFLMDAEKKSLTICERDASGVWQAVRNLPLPVSDFTGLQAVAMAANRPNTIAFLGLNTVAWLAFQGDTWGPS